jgi:hypothetical protein
MRCSGNAVAPSGAEGAGSGTPTALHGVDAIAFKIGHSVSACRVLEVGRAEISKGLGVEGQLLELLLHDSSPLGDRSVKLSIIWLYARHYTVNTL